jgi:peroxiredoxin
MSRKPATGERAADFTLPTPNNPEFHFSAAAGRNTILVFPGAPASDAMKGLMTELRVMREAFDDELVSLFFVVSEPSQLEGQAIRQQVPGIRYFMDYDGVAARAYGLAAPGAAPKVPVSPALFVLDRNHRFLQIVDFRERKPYLAPILGELSRLHMLQNAPDSGLSHAPVLLMERIFEPALCRALIEHYRRRGGRDSGFMREKDGLTVGVVDHGFKRRSDCVIEDDGLLKTGMFRIHNRLVPEILRSFQFNATRIERHIVARYAAESGGFFRPHRDNTTKGTAHRRFAVSLNLNVEEYDGGELRFPEFGQRTYRPPTGGAIVFSCSLLHEATAVTRGERFVYLPFLYGDADAELRERNRRFLQEPTPKNQPERP